MKPGDVYLVHIAFIDPPKQKFIVSLSPEEGLVFFINTKANSVGHPGVVVTSVELPFLSHKSHIQTTTVVRIAVPPNVAADCFKGTLPPNIRKQVRDAVSDHGQLPGRFEKLVLKNF